MHQAHLRAEDPLVPTRLHDSDPLSTRQYARIFKARVTAAGLDPARYGTHTRRITKGIADQAQDKESEGHPASARPHEAYKHRHIPMNRGRRSP